MVLQALVCIDWCDSDIRLCADRLLFWVNRFLSCGEFCALGHVRGRLVGVCCLS